MSLRQNAQEQRCLTCMVHFENCYCKKVEALNLKTKISFIMFKKERFLPSSTANLALNTLKNSKVFHRGLLGQTLPNDFLEDSTYHPLYLYPAPDAIELTPKMLGEIEKPINLVIPDGTWRQAKKIQSREPILERVQAFILPKTPMSIYPLRRQKFAHGLSTFEAMAYALGLIEGSEVQDKLMQNFKIMIDAHLITRVIQDKEKPLLKRGLK